MVTHFPGLLQARVIKRWLGYGSSMGPNEDKQITFFNTYIFNVSQQCQFNLQNMKWL
jgi:hypothetical protein